MPLPSLARLSAAIDWAAWRPRRSLLWWVAGAFVAGLALSAWMVSNQRDVSQSALMAPSTAARDYRPLPIPLPADTRGAPSEAPAVDEDEPSLEPSLPAQIEPSQPPEAARPRRVPQPAASTAATAPEPLRMFAPRYPARALRNGETGTVMVRAEIGPDGVPTSVSVERGSGSRDLDRAAIDAVRRWHFRPALRDGQPTTGSVVVPIDFRQ